MTTTKESPVFTHGKVVVVLDRAEFEALDLFASESIHNAEHDLDGWVLTSTQKERVRIAKTWLARCRSCFAGADR